MDGAASWLGENTATVRANVSAELRAASIAAIEAQRAKDEADEATADRVAAFGDPALDDDAFEIMAAGGMGGDESWEFFDKNEDRLSPLAREAFRKGLRSGRLTEIARPEEETGLIALAYSDARGAILEAADLYARDAIPLELFARVHATAAGASKLPPFVKPMVNEVIAANRPTKWAPHAEHERHRDTVVAFDQWVRSHSDATVADIRKHADDTISNERHRMGGEKIDHLAWPRFLYAPHRDMVTVEELTAARSALVQSIATGEVEYQEAADQAVLLRDWFEALAMRDQE